MFYGFQIGKVKRTRKTIIHTFRLELGFLRLRAASIHIDRQALEGKFKAVLANYVTYIKHSHEVLQRVGRGLRAFINFAHFWRVRSLGVQ